MKARKQTDENRTEATYFGVWLSVGEDQIDWLRDPDGAPYYYPSAAIAQAHAGGYNNESGRGADAPVATVRRFAFPKLSPQE